LFIFYHTSLIFASARQKGYVPKSSGAR